jgi:hypothetical protein
MCNAAGVQGKRRDRCAAGVFLDEGRQAGRPCTESGVKESIVVSYTKKTNPTISNTSTILLLQWCRERSVSFLLIVENPKSTKPHSSPTATRSSRSGWM